MSKSFRQIVFTKSNVTAVAGTLATVLIVMQIWSSWNARLGVEFEVESDFSDYTTVAPLRDAIDNTNSALDIKSYIAFKKALAETDTPTPKEKERSKEQGTDKSSDKPSEKPPEKTEREKELELQLSAVQNESFDAKKRYGEDMMKVLTDFIQPTISTLRNADYDTRSIYSIASVRITNSGEDTAEKVILQIEGRGYAEIKREGGQTRNLEFVNRVELGDLAPNEKIVVTLWVGRVFSRDGFTLSHSKGHADYSFPSKVTGVLAWISQNSIPATFMLFACLVFASILFCLHMASRHNVTSSIDEEEGEKEEEEEENSSPES